MEINQNKSVTAINDLIETCREGREGYITAADNMKNDHFKSQLKQLAQQRESFIHELKREAQYLGGSFKQESTPQSLALDAAGAMHRSWINLKSVVTGGNSKAILNECQNGDAAALRTYAAALTTEGLPENVKEVLQKQQREIMQAKEILSLLKQQI
jgi:uncharacterized protein (TIGR02284 family)